MSMKANIIRDAFGNILVQMEGDMSFDNTIPLRRELEMLAQNHPTSEFSIDMAALNFVGSSGIGHFVETLKLLRTNYKRKKIITLKNVHQDFNKIFKLYGLTEEHVLIENLGMSDDQTEFLNQEFGNRKYTFEN